MTVGSFGGGRSRVHNRSAKDGPSVASCEQRSLSAVNCKYSTGMRTGANQLPSCRVRTGKGKSLGRRMSLREGHEQLLAPERVNDFETPFVMRLASKRV
jgi:hypothetical protein